MEEERKDPGKDSVGGAEMRDSRSVLGPVVVLSIALVTGGWFLQRGVDQETNVYVQARLFQEVIEHVSEQFVDPVDRSGLIESAIEGVLEDLGDPHTSFIDAATWESFRFRSGADAEYGGIGLEILKRDGWVTVINALPGGPALRAGIRAGDQIIEVEGESAEDWETDIAADRLRGTPGTEVEMMIRRPGVDEAIPFKLTRDVIELRSVPFSLMVDDGVGYIPLQVFSETSHREMEAAIASLQAQGMTSLVLDLRDNPGGLLDEGVAVADIFLPSASAIMETRGRASGQNQQYAASKPELLPDLPVVVLVNQNSASSSEIVAGALQDHDRALVIGGRSYGKGSVQTLYRLSGGNILRLTTARWYTPVGRSIHITREDQLASRAPETSTLALNGQRVVKDDSDGRPAVESMGGRTLFGGGGITPDLTVLPDTLTLTEQEAVQRVFRSAGVFATALFNFAVNYVQEHPNLELGFSASPADLDRFYRYLVDEHEVALDRADYTAATRFVAYQLEREIAQQAWDEEAAFRQVLGQDTQLGKAIELLRNSESPQALFRASGGAGAPDADFGTGTSGASTSN